MTKEYKTLRIPKEIHAELEEEKREGETWHGLMRRLLDANEEYHEYLYGDGTPDGDVFGTPKIKETYEKVRKLEEMMDTMPTKTAEKIERRLR